MFPPMTTVNAIGMERLCALQAAISAAGGDSPVVINSDDLHTVENSDLLARYAPYHRPFYEKLHAQRLKVAAWEQLA